MVGVLWVPASGRPPCILILRRQPAGIRDVCSPPFGMLSKQDTATAETQLSESLTTRCDVCVCVTTDLLLHSPVMDL